MDKQRIIQHFDRYAAQRSGWFHRNYQYHAQIIETCRPFLNPGSRLLELGCSTGDLLDALDPDYGVGIDISPQAIAIAQAQYPRFTFIETDAEALPESAPFDEPFDLIILSDLVGYLDDVQLMLENLHRLTHARTRLIVSLWNWIWQPALKLGETLGVKTPDLRVRQNWLSVKSVANLLTLADYQVLQVVPGLLMPANIPFVSPTINALSRSPLFTPLTLLHTVVARPLPVPETEPTTVTVLIPTRNEVGNIEDLIARTPEMGSHTELLFVDGNSTDGTVEKIHEMIEQHPERDIKFMPQVPAEDDDRPPDLMLRLGKGDAVRKGFAAATGEMLMILDSDISVPPEDLPKFYRALVSGKAGFINGTRFNYQQEAEAMHPLNMLGNVGFSLLFSWLLGQRITDTLCGTKVLFKRDYERIAANRSYFGDFDPFGDFDLLFGAAWLGLRIIDLPVRYLARTYGESKVRVNLHGPLLGQMSLLALWHFKVRPLIPGVARRRAVAEEAVGSSPDWLLLTTVLAAVLVVLRLLRETDRRR